MLYASLCLPLIPCCPCKILKGFSVSLAFIQLHRCSGQSHTFIKYKRMQRCGCIAISFTFMLTCLKSTLGPTCTTLLFASLSPGHGWKVESRRSVMPLRHHVGRLVRILSIGRGTIHRKGEKRATTLSTQWPWTSADKCQVRQVTNPKTPGGISHTEMLWEPSCELFLALVCTLRWAYITLSSCTTSWCVCLYDMAKRLHRFQLMSSNLHSEVNVKVWKGILNTVFQLSGSQHFGLCSAMQSIHCSQSSGLTVYFTDQWPPLCSISGMMKRSSLCMPTESGLHLKCLGKKVAELWQKAYVPIHYFILSINSGILTGWNVDCNI